VTAEQLLKEVGPNSLPDTTLNPLVQAAKKFWAPIPWMLEAAVMLELVLHNIAEAAIIAGLLIFNAGIGLCQDGKAHATLACAQIRSGTERVGQAGWNVDDCRLIRCCAG
jgi:H+-transporting ATPase